MLQDNFLMMYHRTETMLEEQTPAESSNMVRSMAGDNLEKHGYELLMQCTYCRFENIKSSEKLEFV